MYSWNCPANLSSSSVYWGGPQPSGTDCGAPYFTSGGYGPCLQLSWGELGAYLSSQNLSFTVTGVGDLYVWVYNLDVSNTDTWFNVCLSSPNPSNQCQASTLTFDQTWQVFYPGNDAATAITGFGTGSPTANTQYNVSLTAVSDSIWSVFNSYYAGTPLFDLSIATDNGTISKSNVTNVVQTTGYSTNPTCNFTQTL